MKKFANVLSKYQFLRIRQKNELLIVTLQNYDNCLERVQDCIEELTQLLSDEKIALDIISYHLTELPNVALLGSNVVKLGIQAPIHVLPRYMYAWHKCRKVAIWSSSVHQFAHFENLPINVQEIELRVRIFDCGKFKKDVTNMTIIAEQVINKEKCSSTIQIIS